MNFVDRSQIDSGNFVSSCLPSKMNIEKQERDNEGNIICAECGEQIPEARLAAIPGCVCCKDCAEEIEKASNNRTSVDDYVNRMPINLIY